MQLQYRLCRCSWNIDGCHCFPVPLAEAMPHVDPCEMSVLGTVYSLGSSLRAITPAQQH